MSRKLAALGLLVVAATVLALVLPRRNDPTGGQPGLTVYCAAGLKQPVEAIARQYRAEFGVEVNLQYGGTGTLLSQLQIAKQGDLLLAADDGSLADASRRELTGEVLPIAVQHPVIAVPMGNPKGVRTLSDLDRPDLRLALANPDCASISKVTRDLLGPRWDALAAKALVMKPTVTEIAADLQLGAVDAAILWDATVPQFAALEAVEVPELATHREHASAAVLGTCARPREALKFARYLAAPDRGGKILAQHGFRLPGGDPWVVKPELILYSGGVNRLAIEQLVQQFADREGADVTTVFNGCGVLCAAMKTMEDSSNPKFPDAYYACDVCFVPPVAEHFPEAVMLTETEIVIAVPKGNAKDIKTLADLARPGLRVGLCNAQQSTLGYMTTAILRSLGLLDSVRKNVVVEVPTADFLINQMRAGSLDAAIVYRVNAQAQAAHFEVIPLPADKAKAVQPFAVRHDSPRRRLAERLLAYLRHHRQSFEDVGFIWRGDQQAVPSAQLPVPEWLRPEQQ
jgi:ABC-type molybdate transport system substrate-binding protein